MQQLSHRITAFVTELNGYLEPLASSLAQVAKEMEPMFQAFILYDGIAKAREATGWLPYRTVPFTQYFRECGGDIAALTTCISSYYEHHASVILQDIALQLPAYDIDNEAKETLSEALSAHEYRLFRCSCRVLLPEIERVIREDWLGIQEVKTLSQALLEGEINKKSLSDFVLNGPQDLVLFGPFASHLFSWVASRADVAQESIPNRHAAAHGWVSYSSSQSSLNTIICADYIFRLTTSFKATKTKEFTELHAAN
jgi:hypothetical protein